MLPRPTQVENKYEPGDKEFRGAGITWATNLGHAQLRSRSSFGSYSNSTLIRSRPDLWQDIRLCVLIPNASTDALEVNGRDCGWATEYQRQNNHVMTDTISRPLSQTELQTQTSHSSHQQATKSPGKGSGDVAVDNILDKPEKPTLTQGTSTSEKKPPDSSKNAPSFSNKYAKLRNALLYMLQTAVVAIEADTLNLGLVVWRLKSSSGKGLEFDALLRNFGGNELKSNGVKRRDLVRVRMSVNHLKLAVLDMAPNWNALQCVEMRVETSANLEACHFHLNALCFLSAFFLRICLDSYVMLEVAFP
ncbi:hypothetical protein Tco_0921423 [Tanacetum coccineum]